MQTLSERVLYGSSPTVWRVGFGREDRDHPWIGVMRVGGRGYREDRSGSRGWPALFPFRMRWRFHSRFGERSFWSWSWQCSGGCFPHIPSIRCTDQKYSASTHWLLFTIRHPVELAEFISLSRFSKSSLLIDLHGRMSFSATLPAAHEILVSLCSRKIWLKWCSRFFGHQWIFHLTHNRCDRAYPLRREEFRFLACWEIRIALLC